MRKFRLYRPGKRYGPVAGPVYRSAGAPLMRRELLHMGMDNLQHNAPMAGIIIGSVMMASPPSKTLEMARRAHHVASAITEPLAASPLGKVALDRRQFLKLGALRVAMKATSAAREGNVDRRIGEFLL